MAPCLVALATVAVWAVFHFIKPLEAFATLIALVVVTAVVTVMHLDVETVGDIASIPNALPPFVVPHFAAIPELLVGGLAVALVGLAQAAGISAAVANPDGSRPNTSGDFVAQGAANLAGGFFGALPTGGSLSRTGVAVSAGAQTRWAGIFAGVWLAALVLIAGSVAELIPMPVIGGLMLVIGAELVIGRWADIKLVLRAAPWSAVAMIVTFLATTQLPLHTAILIGAITSLVLYCVKASESARLYALVPEDGGWVVKPVPDAVESNAVTVLEYTGVGLFAEVPRIDEEWPRVSDSHNAVVVLGLRTLPDVPSSKVLKAMRKWAEQLKANGGRFIIAGVSPSTAKVFKEGGLTEVLGEDGVVPATDRVFGSVEMALNRGQQWIDGHRDAPPPRREAVSRLTHDTPKTDVAHAGIDGLRAARGRAVAQAVAVGAQERPALDHLARDLELRLVRVVSVCGTTRLDVAGVAVPVGGPLPDIARHVEQPVAVGCEAADRCCLPVSGVGQIRELAVPVVGESLPGLLRVRRPRCRPRPVESAAGGDLPFGLGG